MSDEALRALARDVSAAGRIKLARALERVGKRDEAIEALIPARADAEVRRALGEYPAWTHIFGDAGNTGFADVRPIRSTPRVAWKVAGVLDPERTESIPYDLVANAFVVVATRTDHSLAGFDAVTGELRWERAFEVRDDGRASFAGDSLIVVERGAIVALDAWTGEERSRAAVAGLASKWLDGLVAAVAGTTVTAYDLMGARLWATDLPQLSPADRPGFSRAGSLVLVKMAGHMVALDAATGALAWEKRRFLLCGDACGVVVAAPDLGRSLLDLEGREVAQLEDAEWLTTLTPELVVTFGGGFAGTAKPQARMVTFERATKTRGEIAPEVEQWETTACGRDVLYVEGPRGWDLYTFEELRILAAMTLGGGRLWSVPTSTEERARVYSLAAGPRRLYTLAHDGTLTCYSDA